VRYLALVVVACGSGAPATSTTSRAVSTAPSDSDEQRAQREREEQQHHDELVASHRKMELEQQNALAASCSEPKPWNKHERCLPACYPTEPADARSGEKLAAIEHVICRGSGELPYVVVDELVGAKAKRGRGRAPRPHKKGTWQAQLATWFRDEQAAKLPRADVIVVNGNWRARTHPLTHEKLSCVTVVHHTRAPGKLDDCGAIGRGFTCEAAGNGAARAINVVHFRLAEAKRLQAAGQADGCQKAALEAIAVSRGLPRWRQFKKLNVDEWKDKLVYKTRFDGMLDEDALFARVVALGHDAEELYATCGGAANPTTDAEQEQSFHTCW
jgi:hypothetical protein